MHQANRRTRTSPPRAKKPGREVALPIAAATAARGPEGIVEIALVGSAAEDLTDYISALAELESHGVVHVRALVGISETMAARVAAAFPAAHAANSIDTMVLAPGALVLLASSPHAHPSQAGAALRRGWHVLSISPLARSGREATAMAAAANRHERLLAPALPWRFSPACDYLRALCRDQLIGPLVSIEIHDGAPAPAGAADTGDGVLIDVGSRAFDLLSTCVGTPMIARYADDAMGGVEANAFVELGFAEGVQGTVHLSHDWPTARTYDFVFERGLARWRADQAGRITLQLASAPAALQGDVGPVLTRGAGAVAAAAESQMAHIVAQLMNVVGAITRREVLRVSVADAVNALTLVEYCHAHRTLWACPWFSRNEVAHARSLSTPAVLSRP